MKGLIYYRSTCPEFRYGDGKVLGTQPHPSHGSASTHCVLRLNLIKSTFNIYHYRFTHTHTHTHQYTFSKQCGIISSQTLAYIYHTSHSKEETQIQQQSNKYIIMSKAWHINLCIHIHQHSHHIHQDKTRSYPQTNACSCECMPYLSASQHLYINAWTC